MTSVGKLAGRHLLTHSIPSQGSCLGGSLVPDWGVNEKQPISFSPSLPPV